MRFRWSDHSFDLSAAKFAAKSLVLFVCTAAAMQYGVGYARDHVSADYVPMATTTQQAPVIAAGEEVADVINPLPVRAIRKLTIADMIPKEGKFIAADLEAMQIYLYLDGVLAEQYPIKTKGRPGTQWETPAGLYKIQTKEENHFSSIGKVYMPYSMQFYGNYFIHGWTYYPDGTPTPFTFSGGCIKLETEDAEKVFEFADVNTPVFVYDPKETEELPTLALSALPLPSIDADAWLVADLDTGDVYSEYNGQAPENPLYASTLMTALVANETISLDKKISVPEGALSNPSDDTKSQQKTFYVDDLFYPLLLQPNSTIVDALTTYYGTNSFVRSMNAMAHALDMASTTFMSAEAGAPDNTTTAEDLFRLAWYLTYKKSFVWKMAATEKKTIQSDDGTDYMIARAEIFPNISVSTFTTGGKTRHIAIVTLGTSHKPQDLQALSDWIQDSAKAGTQAACAACAPQKYRKIDL